MRTSNSAAIPNTATRRPGIMDASLQVSGGVIAGLKKRASITVYSDGMQYAPDGMAGGCKQDQKSKSQQVLGHDEHTFDHEKGINRSKPAHCYANNYGEQYR